MYFDIHHGTHFGDLSKIGDWAKEVLIRLAKIWSTSTVRSVKAVGLDRYQLHLPIHLVQCF